MKLSMESYTQAMDVYTLFLVDESRQAFDTFATGFHSDQKVFLRFVALVEMLGCTQVARGVTTATPVVVDTYL